ncbi:hypothetical protein B0H14DRAFT_2568985 [Mycena olivaceomarginata]|nr:hypothetical protein B0H14DRAFT_2568985 [Mycena olivaceomarginata]
MSDAALPKREKTPESTFSSWYTLNVVADDELNGLKTSDNGQAVPAAVYPKGSRLWRDISGVSLTQRSGYITIGLWGEMVIYHSPSYCCGNDSGLNRTDGFPMETQVLWTRTIRNRVAGTTGTESSE